MKYLKTYESINTKEKYKKYIVWGFKNSIVIFEVLNQFCDDSIPLKRLKLYYDRKTYIKDMKIQPEDEMIFYKSSKDIDKGLLYQSDKLEECVENINYLNDIKKYNI